MDSSCFSVSEYKNIFIFFEIAIESCCQYFIENLDMEIKLYDIIHLRH